MRLNAAYRGGRDPFEGERVLTLRALPSGAVVRAARITLAPVELAGRPRFEERFSFAGTIGLDELPAGPWGVEKVDGPGVVEIDLHARRTLVAVEGANLNDANLLVDAGGLFVAINELGGVKTPDDDPFTLDGTANRLPGVATTRMRLVRAGATVPPMTARTVTVRSAPANLTVRLGTLAPFFTRLGELTGPETSPDFAAMLRAFLDDAEVANGVYVLPFGIQAEGVARLDVSLEVEFLLGRSLLPEGLAEVLLPFAAGGVPTLPAANGAAVAAELPPGATVVPGATTARVVGAFQPTRIAYGPVGAPVPAGTVAVRPGVTQAQPVQPAGSLTVSALDVLVASVDRRTTLNLTLLPDADGKPWGDPLLPQPLTVRLDRATAAALTWTSTPLPAEVRLAAGTRVWLVLEALEGEAAWGVLPAGPADASLLTSTDAGVSWRAMSAAGVAGTLSGLLRLRTTPAEFRMPVRLSVGAGDRAEPVSLARFEPLGRVDLTLDIPEVAAAFDTYLRRTAPPGCPPGEQLANGGFETWHAVGRDPGPTARIPLANSPRALALDRDGRHGHAWSMGTDANGDDFGFVEPLDISCNTAGPAFPAGRYDSDFPAVAPKDMVVDPDGGRMYVLTVPTGVGSFFEVVDLRAAAPLGRVGPRSMAALAGGPDGRRLYLAALALSELADWAFLSLDTGRLDDALRAEPGRSDVFDDALVASESSTLPAGLVPLALAAVAARDGSTLACLLAGTGTTGNDGSLFLFDPATGSLGSPVAVAEGSDRLAVSPDGRLVVVASSTEVRLQVVDVASRSVVGSPVQLPSPLRALAVTPDGTRAVTVREAAPSVDQNKVGVADLRARLLETEISAGPAGVAVAPVAITVTPQGDAVYVANQDDASLTAIPLGVPVPAEWTVTAGRVAPICVPGGLAAELGGRPGQPATGTGLSQVLAVAAGCHYDLGLRGRADRPGCAVEVHWLGSDCALLATEELPIDAVEPPPGKVGILPGWPPPLVLRRRQLTAPPGARQAQVRLRAPGGALAVVDEVSLAAADAVTTNDDLQAREADVPTGWTVAPQPAPGVSFGVGPRGGVRVVNSGLASASVSQVVSVTAGRGYRLEFHGHVAPRPPAADNPRLELGWRTADDAPAGPDVVQPLDALGFDRSRAEGTVPITATQAQLRLVVPAGTSLEVASVSLHLSDQVAVPLNFVAEAPGELTVSGTRVVYDLVKPSPPEVPTSGLCTPTPPGVLPGTPAGHDVYCPSCEADRQLLDAKPALTMAGRPASTGRCHQCGASLVRHGGPMVTGMPSAQLPAAVPRDTSTALHAPAAGTSLLVAGVARIGRARARRLAAVGIHSAERLAACPPEIVARVLDVSPKLAGKLVAAARDRVGATGQAPPQDPGTRQGDTPAGPPAGEAGDTSSTSASRSRRGRKRRRDTP